MKNFTWLNDWTLVFEKEDPFQCAWSSDKEVKTEVGLLCDAITGMYGPDRRTEFTSERPFLHGKVVNKEGFKNGDQVQTSDVVAITIVGAPYSENKRRLYEGKYEALQGEMIAETSSGSKYHLFLGDQTWAVNMLLEKYRYGDYQPANGSIRFDNKASQEKFREFMSRLTA